MVKTVYKSNKDIANLGAEIKTAYEGEADTNAFTDAEKVKLSAFDVDTSTGNVNVPGKLTVGNDLLATDDQFYLGRTPYDNDTRCGITFDESDYIEYIRGTDKMTFAIGGFSYLLLGDSEVSISHDLSIRDEIYNWANNQVVRWSSGNAAGVGANISLHGGIETNAYDVEFKSGSTTELHFDASEDKWDFQSNKVSIGGDVAIGVSDASYKLEVDTGNTSTIVASFQTTNVAVSTAAFSSSGTTSASHVRCGAYDDDFIVYAGQTEQFRVNSSGGLNIKNIPTSSAGLNSGDIWSDAGTLKIV